ncbi:MAG: preprotein translocase subunit YajC [Syntrophomonas sp.]|nr:preprotein translocase subunit YajC [Syntrophomonas sp.]
MSTQTWLPTAIYLGVFLAIFYYLIIMPRKKQEKKHKEVIASLKRGDKVVTIGGLRGEVARVKEETMILKVNDTVEMEFLKTAVAYKEEEK